MNEKQPQWLIAGCVDDLSPIERSLVLQTLDLLYQAELSAVIDALVTRMLGPIPEGPVGDAHEARLVDASGQLQPFVELALRATRHAATAEGWTPAMRTQHALDAIAAAGF